MTETHIRLYSLIVLSWFAFAALPAAVQQTLYEDGPINGQTDGWSINLKVLRCHSSSDMSLAD